MFASRFKGIDFRAYDRDLVILNLVHGLGLYKLYAVHTGTVKFHTHILTTDDLAFKCRGECNRNIYFCDLDLNISCFQGNLVEISHIRACDQGTRYFFDVLSLIRDHRESKLDRTGSCSQYNVIYRFEGIYKCRYPLCGISKQCCCIPWCYITKDQCCTKCNRYYMDHRGNILAKRHDTKIVAHLKSQFLCLVNDTANQCYKDTLCLVAFDQVYTLLGCRCGSKDHGYTWDISCYKRYTKLTDD